LSSDAPERCFALPDGKEGWIEVALVALAEEEYPAALIQTIWLAGDNPFLLRSSRNSFAVALVESGAPMQT
jgi:hypothetical protein